MSEAGREPPRPLPLRPRRKCPICGRPAARDAYPFCSKRCADEDLGRWLSGSYVIPAAKDAEEEDGADHGG